MARPLAIFERSLKKKEKRKKTFGKRERLEGYESKLV